MFIHTAKVEKKKLKQKMHKIMNVSHLNFQIARGVIQLGIASVRRINFLLSFFFLLEELWV